MYNDLYKEINLQEYEEQATRKILLKDGKTKWLMLPVGEGNRNKMMRIRTEFLRRSREWGEKLREESEQASLDLHKWKEEADAAREQGELPPKRPMHFQQVLNEAETPTDLTDQWLNAALLAVLLRPEDGDYDITPEMVLEEMDDEVVHLLQLLAQDQMTGKSAAKKLEEASSDQNESHSHQNN